MSIGIAYNPCKNCPIMDKCSICELTYYRKGYIKSTTADVEEVRHGEWKMTDFYCAEMSCSICGFKYYGEYDKECMSHYCPDCGAKMDGERKEG